MEKDPQKGSATNDPAAGDPETRGVSAKNRVWLAWILAGCAVLAALGFFFALWLREQPKIG